MDYQRSIHPRNWPENRGNSEKSNTAKPHKGKGKLAKKMRRLNSRRLDHAATVKSVSVKNAAAFKSPGSMNPKK